MAATTVPLGPRIADGVFIPPRYRSVHVSNGKLYVFERGSITVLRGWPAPLAWRKTRKAPAWRHFRPDIGDLLARADYANESDACRRFFLEFHPETLAAVRPLRNRHWHVLSLIARCPGGLDLARGSPALAFCLASNWAFHKPAATQPMRAAKRLVAGRQRDALGWLGFPATESAARVLRRVVPSSITMPGLFRLRSILRRREAWQVLSHLPRINEGAIRLLVDPKRAVLVTPRLVQEAALDPYEDLRPWRVWVLRDTIAMAGQLGREIAHLRFESAMQLRAAHDKIMHEFNLAMASGFADTPDCRFPPPPLPGVDGSIVPLVEPAQLVEEGRELHHCVASYVRDVALGRSYVYRVLAPERATLEIRPSRYGRWRLAQLHGACNARVSDATEKAVGRWLRQAQAARRPLKQGA